MNTIVIPRDLNDRIVSAVEFFWTNWFIQIWEMPGASTRNGHPAPFPLELATRLVKMFSFVGDVILDPFSGSGTTMLAAINTNRNSIGIETEEYYCHSTIQRLEDNRNLFSMYKVSYVDLTHERDCQLPIT